MGDRKFFIIAFLMLVMSVSAAKVTERVYTSAQGALRVQVCNSRMVRITKMPTDRFPADEPWMVVKYDFDGNLKWKTEKEANITNKAVTAVPDGLIVKSATLIKNGKETNISSSIKSNMYPNPYTEAVCCLASSIRTDCLSFIDTSVCNNL